MEAEGHTLRLAPRHQFSVLMGQRICLSTPPTTLHQNNQSLDVLPFFVTPSVKRYIPSTGILTCCPSTTPVGLALGSGLPWEDSPGPGTLVFTVGEILALLIATHFSISSCGTSNAPYGTPSSAHTMLSYHSYRVHSFGTTLKPRYIFRAEPLVQ